MARRTKAASVMIQIQRDLERQRREQERQHAAAVRAHDKAVRAMERARKAEQKEQARLHVEARLDEAAAMQADLEADLDDLLSILKTALDVDEVIDPQTMKEEWAPAPFDPGLLGQETPVPDMAQYMPPEPSSLSMMAPWVKSKYEKAVADGRARYEAEVALVEEAETQRVKRLQTYRRQYDEWRAREQERVATQHAEVDRFIVELTNLEPEAVVEYFEMVLDGSVWPDGFPQSFVVAYDKSSQLLGVDYTLPSMEIVPDVRLFKYVKTRDEITSTAQPQTKRRATYMQVIAQSALRVLHELFRSDRFGIAETVALNCFVNTLDPATGRPVQPCVLSVRTTRETFTQINLAQVDPVPCLKGLAAAVSPKPSELTPVRPVIELKMIDPRFVDEQDILSELDQRPNLMELTPSEFESLITNLFLAMGLESRQTQPSRDGGVDCVAYDPRPIFGGKVVIQAKRYKNTVGVGAVRDLYGTLQNEGASKGILVTTSGYGRASYEFAKGKPLELLSGPNLLFLLEEHCDIAAKIEVPSDWKDPTADQAVVNRFVAAPNQPSEPGSRPQHDPFPQPSSGRG